MMAHDENSRFFSEEDVKKAFHPVWPAGTEIVCYCRSTDSRDTIEQIAQRGGWKIVKYVHIDELPIALWCCKQAASIAKDENDMGNVWYAENWLKLLKERYTWKPSGEQMHYLYWIANITLGDSVVEQEVSKHLNELYEDLKKLKG